MAKQTSTTACITTYPLEPGMTETLLRFLRGREEFPKQLEEHTSASRFPKPKIQYSNGTETPDSQVEDITVILDFSATMSYYDLPLGKLANALIAGRTWSRNELVGYIAENITDEDDHYINIEAAYMMADVIREFHILMANFPHPVIIDSLNQPYGNTDLDFSGLGFSAGLFSMSTYVVTLRKVQ